jgi:hypothetical protein
MGIFSKSPERQRQDAERKAYRAILAKQTAQVERQAYAEEAKKQAALKAKRLAVENYNKPSKGQVFGNFIKNVGNKIITPSTQPRMAIARSPTRKVVTYKKVGKRYVKQVRRVARQVKQQMATPAPKPVGLNLGYSGSFYN